METKAGQQFKIFGIALVDLDGTVYEVGDYEQPFSIQSISKVHTLSMVAHVFQRKLWSRVNVEPSCTPFNSIAQVEFEKGIPRLHGDVLRGSGQVLFFFGQ